MPRQNMSLEQVERCIHRITGLFPRETKVLEFGISPLSKKISDIYNLSIIERGKIARRWDIDQNLVISTPIKQFEEGDWYWFPDYDKIPNNVDFLIIHNHEGNKNPNIFLKDKTLRNLAQDIIFITNDGNDPEEILNNFTQEYSKSPNCIFSEPDLSIWHFEMETDDTENKKSANIDLITRIFYALGWRERTRRRIEGLAKKSPNDVRYKELRARLNATPGKWEIASHQYEKIYDIEPHYRDVKWQVVRASIYSSRWSLVGRVLSQNIKLQEDSRIKNMIEKKFKLIGLDASIYAIELMISNRFKPDWMIEKWANAKLQNSRDMQAPVARIALEKFHGTHIGHQILNKIRLGEEDEIDKIIKTCIEKHGIIATLESISIDETLPTILNEVIKEILSTCDSKTIHDAIKAIGRKGDPSQFVGRSSIMEMIDSGTSIQTWMIEFALRSDDKSLLNSLFKKGLPGTGVSIIESLTNLIELRRDNRITNLIEVITEHPSLYAHQGIRRVVCRALFSIAEPGLAHAFAMESIRLDPHDAVCGFIGLEAAISTGISELILETADIVLSMRSRSSHIDYGSVAIAAIRIGEIEYAKDILKRNRLRMDLRAQRIRVGLPFNINEDWGGTLEEIELTPAKFRNDPTILIYEAKSLASSLKHEAAENVAHKINDLSERAALLYSLRRSWGDDSGALESWNTPLIDSKMSPMPLDWGDSGFNFLSLGGLSPQSREKTGDLVSVIMTVHKWNDAFPVAVSSVLNQSHQNLELIVIDDNSSEQDVDLYDQLLQDKRIIRIRMDENVGTYSCRNRGIDVARGKYVTFTDSDDWNHPERVQRGIEQMESHNLDVSLGRYIRLNQNGIVSFNGGRISRFSLVTMMIRMSMLRRTGYRFDGRARFSADSEFFERLKINLGEGRVKRHSNLDLVALHHDDSLTGGGDNAIGWTGPGEVRTRYVSGYRRWHIKLRRNQNVDNVDLCFSPPSINSINENPTEIELRLRTSFSLSYNSPTEISREEEYSGDSIFAFMATYPGGFHHVGDTIRTLLNQSLKIQKIFLHVNADSRPPHLPKDPRLKVILSKKDLADNGKFAHLEGKNGYILTVDDDIEYPTDYAEKMIQEIENHHRKAIVGVHGATLPFGPTLSRWSQYKNMRRSHIFSTEHASRQKIDILGTGTVAFHSSIGFPDGNKMPSKRMVDLHLATWAMERNIPMYLVPRSRNWLKEFENISEERIWNMTQEDKELQIQMMNQIRSIKFWSRGASSAFKISNGPLSIGQIWPHRELPPGLILPKIKKWKPLSNEPLVTIYIPAYNVMEYIVDSVNSALNQTYSRIEVCIHDDGSTDNTLSILKGKFGNEKRVKISSNKNQGIGAASNQAIENGTGDVILQLDADDVIEPNTVELLLARLQEGHVCTYGNFKRIKPDGELIDNGWEEAEFSRERMLRSMIVHPPRIFRRDAWEEVGKHDENLTNAVDYDFFLRLSEVGTMSHVRETLYSYRILQTSTSRAKEEIQTSNTLEVVRRSLERSGISDYSLHVPNPQRPRSFTIEDIRFRSSIEH